MSNLSNNFIAGDWIAGSSTISNINPSDTNDVIGEYAQASKSQLEDAINSAQIAQKKWAATGLEQRQAVLMKIGEEMMTRSAELGELLSREEGKPVAECRRWLVPVVPSGRDGGCGGGAVGEARLGRS